MKKLSIMAPFGFVGLSLIALSAYALPQNSNNHLKIVTKDFPTPLLFVVTQNGTYAPNLPVQFVLSPESGENAIKTPILSPNVVYISVRPINNPSYKAFFGVQKQQDGQVMVHGYTDVGVAYSWRDGKNVTVKFCTHEQYVKKGQC